MSRRRWIAPLAIMGVAGLALAGCAEGGGSSGGDSSGDAGGTVRIAGGITGSEADALQKVFDDWSKDSGVKSLEDFKGKKVSVGARGSGNEVNCRQIFGFYGLDYKNIEPIFLPYGETADQFKDRQVDGFVFTIGTPNPAIQDITAMMCSALIQRYRSSGG